MTDKTSKATIYRDKRGEYRWRVKARNGRVLADSGEGYVNRIDAEHGLIEARSGISELALRLLDKHIAASLKRIARLNAKLAKRKP